jgi:hypothetical protein
MPLRDRHIFRRKRLGQIVRVKHKNAAVLYSCQKHVMPAFKVQAHDRRPAAPQGAHDSTVSGQIHIAPRQIVGADGQSAGLPNPFSQWDRNIIAVCVVPLFPENPSAPYVSKL